ncbi:ferritin-like domain-containing protein [Kitasatospora sp. CB01950]|uniref:ferritin-like domain-containing protein n=1 Tax=Kitasatospora sp. CB01950 TaxID=1703930 RepID=UPI0009F90A65|nr:ferritin-like domain-containing protein [Kitasatospora sp. CB01950]
MPAPTRRSFLTLGALALLCGCTSGPDRARRPAAEDADRPLRLRQLAATDALLADYDAVLAANPGDADRLGNLRDDVVQHREALAQSLPASSPAASPSAASPAARTVADLAAAELRTAGLRLADLAAASPALARTLASAAAAGAAHAAALGDTGPIAADGPSPAPSALAAADTEALQSALAAEHAAVYGYGVVGAFLPAGPQREDGRAAYAAHQSRRDAWQRLLAAGGASPTAAAPGYRLPFPVKDAATAGQLAAHLEIQLTAAYADLCASTALRPQAATALRECTLRAAHWGADLPALPGLTPAEPADPAPTTGAGPGAG